MRKKVFIALRMAGIAGQEKLSGIFRFLGEDHDWDITLVRTAAEFTPARIRTALLEGYDGFIVSIPDTEQTAALLASTDVPTIVMDIHSPRLSARRKNIVFIRNSSEEIGRAAANHLLAIGSCRSYAFVHNPSVMQWSTDRCKAFRETLRDNGFWCHELKTPEALQKLERPVGVFAANDDRGYDVIEFCHAHRIRVPEDAVVLGINNDTLICENCHPRLSSIQPDFEQEGYLAAETLSRLMQPRNPAPPQPRNPATLFVGVKTIVRRESTAELSSSGKLVQKALAYIQSRADKGLTPQDLIEHLGCSRRLADLRFREVLDASILEVITEHRLKAVCRRLTQKNATIEAIATDCGFKNSNYLKTLFLKHYGMTMKDWRQRH